MARELYCHFSFRRPKNRESDYGIFCCAFYAGVNSKKCVGKFTKAIRLWEDQQYVCAIQSFSYALDTIWQGQKELIDKGVHKVYLVTDNSTLAKWISNPNKNKEYSKYMKRAYSNYVIGRSKELIIGVGLAEVVKYEKSYKYCKEEYLMNEIPVDLNITDNSTYKLDVKGKSINDIIKEVEPIIEGVEECLTYKEKEIIEEHGIEDREICNNDSKLDSMDKELYTYGCELYIKDSSKIESNTEAINEDDAIAFLLEEFGDE